MQEIALVAAAEIVVLIIVAVYSGADEWMQVEFRQRQAANQASYAAYWDSMPKVFVLPDFTDSLSRQ